MREIVTITTPHANMIIGNQIEGFKRFRSKFAGTSIATYVKKNAVTIIYISLHEFYRSDMQ